MPYEYRNKMEFSFGDEEKDGPLALGMHKRGSFYDIVTVDGCRIVDGDYRKILKCALDYFSDRKVSFFHRLRHGFRSTASNNFFTCSSLILSCSSYRRDR